MTGLEIGMLAMAAGQMFGGVAKDLGNKRPEYEIPEALKQSLALAKMKAIDPNAPGYDQAKANLDMQSSNQLLAAQMAGDPSKNIQSIAGAQTSGLRDLAAMNAQSQEQDLANLQNVLGQVANAQDTQWQVNKFAPTADNKREGRDMFGAGAQNLFQMLMALSGGGPMSASTAASATKSGKYQYGAPW